MHGGKIFLPLCIYDDGVVEDISLTCSISEQGKFNVRKYYEIKMKLPESLYAFFTWPDQIGILYAILGNSFI